MIVLEVDTNDKSKIDEFISFAIEKFNFKIKVSDEQKVHKKSLGISLDEKIKSSRSINSKQAYKVKTAINGINSLMDPNKINLSLAQVKEQYFAKKNS
ncbi:MAG: hypothetical protein CR967_04300 [Proteobacteria bacterium]|nr:MAG: hypothetical protein CR967_04300 [Pseudomonadota bacterium]